MIFKVGPFRGNKEYLVKHLRRNHNDVSLLSLYCACNSLPVAAAIVFCIEEFPEHADELEKKLEKIKEFYGYDSVEE